MMLDKVIEQNIKYGDAANEIHKYTGPEDSNISDKEILSLYLNMANAEVQYRASNGVFEEIIKSGKLDLF